MTDPAKRLFEQALDLPPERRHAFVDGACGDDARLRSRLVSLLRAHDEAGDFLEHPTGLVEAAAVEIEATGDDLEPGQRIGTYVLSAQIGRGGFGSVWRARQHSPVQREVALKVLHRGLDTGRVMQRFLAERQMLARMDHPAIARMFDAGATPEGRPWFAMELVDGEPITQHADRRGLDLRTRLAVFEAVCLAVQHAHHKGIVHRDLKPSNVLVVERDGRPQPVVIDFGVARVLDDDGAAPMTITEDGQQLLGTPDYMSPEQAAGDRDMVDTRTDVFSLGVVLYELAAGSRPFERSSGPAAQHDLLRRIREADPEPPSRRAPARRLPRELDWIAARAMAKQPAHRYQTAAALADDVRRLLDGEPVLAGPPSTFYRLRKLAARHRLAVSAIAFVLLSLGLGLLVAARGWIEAERESAKARRALDIVDEIWEGANPTRFGRGDYPVRELFADFSRELPRRTAGQPEVELRLRTTIGRLHRILGLIPDAEMHARRAVGLAREHGTELELAKALVEHARALFDHNRIDAARAAADEAVDLATEPRSSDLALLGDALEIAANCSERAGDRASAIAQAERALEVRRERQGAEDIVRSLLQLARIHGGTGNVPEAMQLVHEALQQLEPLGPAHPDRTVALQHLAFLQQRQGDQAGAEASFRESLDLRREFYGADHPNVAWAEADLAWLLHDRSRDAEAEPLLRHAVEALRRRLGEDHLYVTEATQRLGTVLTGLGRLDEAERLLTEAVERYRTLADHPTDGLVGCLGNLSTLRWSRGDRQAAVRTRQEALDLARRELPPDHFVVSVSMTNLAYFQAELGDDEAAVELLREALALSSAAGRAGESRIQRARLAEILDRLGRGEEAAAVRDGR